MVKYRYLSVRDTISLFPAGASGPRGCVGCGAGFGQKVPGDELGLCGPGFPRG